MRQEEMVIRKQRELWKAAFEAGDVERIMSFYAPGAATVAFDVLPPLQYSGFDAYKQHWSLFLALFQGPPKVDVAESQIVCSGDVAFVHALVRLKATLRDGRPLDIWMRATNGMRKIGGEWLVVHDHVSLPVDITTGVPSMNLTP